MFCCVVVVDLYKVLAMKCYRDGRIGAALSWCIRGKVGGRFNSSVFVVVFSLVNMKLFFFFFFFFCSRLIFTDNQALCLCMYVIFG